jgi:2-polyprenyl-6-methoxyphenol hydroxylase-like FAD-dependent oxidoreductase
MRTQKAIVAGGSIVGLIAANLLHRMGWDVQVFERTPGVMEGRGAGITVLPGLEEGLIAAGVSERELGNALGVLLPARVALSRTGEILAEREFAQVMTSWRRLYDLLKAVFPDDRYFSDRAIERVEQDAGSVTAVCTDSSRVQGDLLIAADGLRSTVRAQLMPDVKPFYPGYIAWRCLTSENAQLSPAVRELLFSRYAVCVAPGQQGIGYAVPGPDHRCGPGERQHNVVWYQPVAEPDLRDLMTDEAGRHHANGIPPSLIRPEVRARMRETAQEALAPQFAESIAKARLTFFQPIVDLESPRLVFGRVAIVGDAAFTARPHVAMGVPKGAGDAIALAEAIRCGGADWLGALGEFESKRLRIGRTMVARGRYLGAYMQAQAGSEAERLRAERAREPEQVMMETAAPFDYGS